MHRKGGKLCPSQRGVTSLAENEGTKSSSGQRQVSKETEGQQGRVRDILLVSDWSWVFKKVSREPWMLVAGVAGRHGDGAQQTALPWLQNRCLVWATPTLLCVHGGAMYTKQCEWVSGTGRGMLDEGPSLLHVVDEGQDAHLVWGRVHILILLLGHSRTQAIEPPTVLGIVNTVLKKQLLHPEEGHACEQGI